MQPSIRHQLEEMERMGGATFVEDLIELFLSECTMRLTKLETALAQGNLVEAGQLFHQVKGSAASTGAGRLYRICAVGEMASEKGEGELAQKAGRLGAKELAFLQTSLKDWKQKA
ncbi:MAG TPA: Hpt domain-containing protein [Candidatus Methylacidiphilales bacterium]|nr:Hpt domain-containing protein [Candidatus Methylacidiphilales bacterium]